MIGEGGEPVVGEGGEPVVGEDGVAGTGDSLGNGSYATGPGLADDMMDREDQVAASNTAGMVHVAGTGHADVARMTGAVHAAARVTGVLHAAPSHAAKDAHRRGRRQAFDAYERAKRAGGYLGDADRKPEGPAPRRKLFGAIPRIEGDRVVLDRVVDADAEALRDLIDNPRVQRYLPTYLFEKQYEDAREAIGLLYGDLFRRRESLILAIRPRETGELAGLAEFYGLRDELHKVSVGYRLRERWWGHGLATETARLMVRYLYGETDIEIITASTMVENLASAHVLEKADFIRSAHGVEEDWGFLEPTIVDKWFC